jgi:hypothetical protein
VTVTLYVVVDDGVTVMVCVVAPVFQRYDANTPASSVTGEAAHVAVGPVIVGVGAGLTLIVALPDDVPLHDASLSDVIVYVIVDDGETERLAVVPLLTTCVKPSDQVMFHGALPVSDAAIDAELPVQIEVLPLTLAVGAGLTLTNVTPPPVPLQNASVMVVTL